MSETQESDQDASRDSSIIDRSVPITTYVQWGALVGLLVLAMIAAIQFYTSASRAISLWITSEYVPIFQAGFNLVLLLLAAIGISLLTRRLSQ